MQPVESPRVLSRRYELTHLIARGGMAEVYRAFDHLLDRPVALKILFPELSVDRAFVERFRREAQAAANLSHPNIVPVFDWGEDDSTYFIVMEYVEGKPLSALLRSQGPLPPRQVAEIGGHVAAALAYAHRHGVIHRDVKPGNVLITDDGLVKVTDFGIARAVNTEESLTQTGAVMGTATYFSPEQAEGLGVDRRSDVYSLGVVLFELLTGRPPFLGDTPVAVASKHVRDIPPTPRSINPEIPVALEAVVMKAMTKAPEGRYTSADELRADLQRYLSGEQVMAAPLVGAPQDAQATTRTEMMGTLATPVSSAPTGVVPGVAALDHTQALPVPEAEATAEHLLGASKRHRRGSRALLLLLIVLLAALGVIAYLLVDTFVGGVSVPNVIGENYLVAASTLKKDGLAIGAVTQRVNSKTAGTVLSTNPPPGTRIAKGAKVALIVSRGPVMVTVPDVKNMGLSAAESTIRNDHLRYALSFVQSTAAQNIVIAQSPAPGTRVRRNSVVTLTLPTPTNQVAVPDLEGDTPQVAAVALQNAGLALGSQSSQCSNTAQNGQVASSSPPAGTEVARGTTISIVVSTGPCQVVVRDVRGEPQGRATSDLQGQGLTVTAVPTTACNPSQAGDVVDQSPGPGTQVTLPTTVTIDVCSVSTTTTTSPTTTTPTPTTTPGP